MKFSVLMCILSFAAITKAAEFRTFTNLEGKTIEACILQHDAEGGRVLLMLQNNKKAWIETGSLSQEDQLYIQDYYEKMSSESDNESKTEVTETATLSKKELKDIGQKLVKAVAKEDQETWSSMLYDVYLDDPRISREHVLRYISRLDISVGDVDEENLCVELNVVYPNPNDSESRWLFSLPDGKIKYDALVFQHPLEQAVEQLKNLSEQNSLGSFQTLQYTLKIPCYDYDIDASSRDREAAIEQIIEWIIATDGDWDNSEPKCSYPSDGFKELVRKLKGI